MATDRPDTAANLPLGELTYARQDSQDKGGLLGDAAGWTRKNIAAPLINNALLEPYNAAAHISNKIAGQEILGEKKLLEVDQDAKFLSPTWFVQNVSGGLGMIVPYALAGKFAGGAMRMTGASVGAAWLRNEELAAIVGAASYDGLRVPKEGESRIGNALGGAAAFTVFGFGNKLSRGATGGDLLVSRAVTGMLGANAQHATAKFYNTGEAPTFEEALTVGVSGAAMNLALPAAQDFLTRTVTNAKLNRGWSVDADQYAQVKYGRDLVGQSTELKSLLNESRLPQVKVSDTSGFSLAGRRGEVQLPAAAAPEVLGQGLANVVAARNNESTYKQAAQLLAQGDKQGSWIKFREARLAEETAAHDSKQLIDHQLNKSPLLEPEHLGLEIGAWPAPGGVSYERRFRQEFDQFAQSKGAYRPGQSVGAQPVAEPLAQQIERLKQSGLTGKDLGSETQRLVATSLIRDLQEAKFIGVDAGGSVRDDHLAIRPKDFDIATSATPDQVIALFKSKGYTVVEKGKQFGVIDVVINDTHYEIASLRNDGQYSDGRRPDQVKYVTSLFEDAARRDLRFNAMFRDPTVTDPAYAYKPGPDVLASRGIVYDFFGGRQDLQDKIVRTVGDPLQRFHEDKLRMMRAPRFASRYEDFTLAPEVTEAIRARAADITSVSGERVREELRGILTSRQPLVALDSMMDTGLMRYVFPELVELTGPKAMQDPIWHPEGSTWTHTRMVVDNLRGNSFEVMMSGLLHDIGKPKTQLIKPDGRISNINHDIIGADMANAIADRLVLSTAERTTITGIVRNHMRSHVADQMRPETLRAFMELPYFEGLRRLQHADASGTGRPDHTVQSLKPFFDAQHKYWTEEVPPAQRLFAKPIIDGKILKELGLKQGLRVGQIKNQAYQAQRDGAFTDPAEAHTWLTKNIPEFFIKPIVDGDFLRGLGLPPGKRIGEIKTAAQKAQDEGAFADAQQARLWLSQNFPEFAEK